MLLLASMSKVACRQKYQIVYRYVRDVQSNGFNVHTQFSKPVLSSAKRQKATIICNVRSSNSSHPGQILQDMRWFELVPPLVHSRSVPHIFMRANARVDQVIIIQISL